MTASRLIPVGYDPIPSHSRERATRISVTTEIDPSLDAVGFGVHSHGDAPAALGVDRDALTKAGFGGLLGETLLVTRPAGPVFVAVGLGAQADQSAHSLRDAAAAFARASSKCERVGLSLHDMGVDAFVQGQAITEGALLARYRFTALQSAPKNTPLVSIDLITDATQSEQVQAGVALGEITARATNLARDLANNPPGHLTATVMGDVALRIGPSHSLKVEVFDKKQLIALGCGGLLGVNAGSAEEPRMIKLTYSPAKHTSHIAIVGKGIMYDSGGISLKPSDPMHLIMKMDMAGAAAVLGAMTALEDLGCPAKVTAFLMCTDNMPSGTAIGLGDVLTIRGGTTVEVKNTDAEGRLVMADALVLATEEHPDAIIDIATLTGSALQALGTRVAAVFGNDQDLVERANAASANTDESIWQLPLESRYREQLNSTLADISNMGGPFNVAITAALFLNEFVAGIPWVHFDIAGTMHSKKDDSWRTEGATGFGTRLLIDLVVSFAPRK